MSSKKYLITPMRGINRIRIYVENADQFLTKIASVQGVDEATISSESDTTIYVETDCRLDWNTICQSIHNQLPEDYSEMQAVSGDVSEQKILKQVILTDNMIKFTFQNFHIVKEVGSPARIISASFYDKPFRPFFLPQMLDKFLEGKGMDIVTIAESEKYATITGDHETATLFIPAFSQIVDNRSCALR